MDLRASASSRINTRQYENAVRRTLRLMSAQTRQAVVQTGIDVQNEARRRAPVDTGRLRSSIVHRVSGGSSSVDVAVGTNVNYAEDVENGTPPHVILPKNGKALYWPGARHPVARVNHPGTRAQPFMGPAVAMAPVFFSKNMRKVGR